MRVGRERERGGREQVSEKGEESEKRNRVKQLEEMERGRVVIGGKGTH